VWFDVIFGIDNDLDVRLDPFDQIMHIMVEKKKCPEAGESEGCGNDADHGSGLVRSETHERFSKKIPQAFHA